MWIAALIGGLMLSPATEPTIPGRHSVAVLPLTVEGKLPKHYVERLRARLTHGLTRADLRVIDVEAGDPIAQCARPDCFARYGLQLDADFVLQTRVRAAERDYELSVELIDASNGATVANRSQSCEFCGLGEAGEVLADHAAALQTRIDALVVGPPMLRLSSSPPGAVVYVDGEAVGTTPLDRIIKPGRHWVRVELAGYAPEEAPLVASPGTETPLSFELDALDVAKTNRRRTTADAQTKVGWALLGVGVAAVGAGIPLLAVDGRPNRLVCSGDNVDADGDCRLLMDSRRPGLGLTVAGAATVAVGLALALSRRRGPRSVQASLTWARGPSLTLRGRF